MKKLLTGLFLVIGLLFVGFSFADTYQFNYKTSNLGQTTTIADYRGNKLICSLTDCYLGSFFVHEFTASDTRYLLDSALSVVSSGSITSGTGDVNESLTAHSPYYLLVGQGDIATPTSHSHRRSNIVFNTPLSQGDYTTGMTALAGVGTTDGSSIYYDSDPYAYFRRFTYSGTRPSPVYYTYSSPDGTGTIDSNIDIELELGVTILTGYPNYYLAGTPYTGATGATIYSVNEGGTGYDERFITTDHYLDSALDGYYEYVGGDTYNFIANYSVITGYEIAYLEFTGTTLGTGNMSSQLAEKLVELSRSNIPMFMSVTGGFLLIFLLFGIFGVGRKKKNR